MTPQQFVGLGVRLFAIWIASENVGFLFSISSSLKAMNQSDKALYAYMMGGWWLLLAILLWFFPMWIAHKLIPRTRFENMLDLHTLEVARVGCGLLGLWLLIVQLRAFLWYFFVGVLSMGNDSFVRSLSQNEKVGLAVAIVQAAFAIALMLFSASFARLLLRAPRAAGSEV
jgi:hypothetical protein